MSPDVDICSRCRAPMPCHCQLVGAVPRPLSRWESAVYLGYVRALPCAVPGCRNEDVEAAHFGRRGVGVKAHDFLAVPLCRRHHAESHRYGPRWRFAERVTGWQLATMAGALVAGLGGARPRAGEVREP